MQTNDGFPLLFIRNCLTLNKSRYVLLQKNGTFNKNLGGTIGQLAKESFGYYQSAIEYYNPVRRT